MKNTLTFTLDDMDGACPLCGGVNKGIGQNRWEWFCGECYTKFVYDDDRDLIVTRNLSYEDEDKDTEEVIT